MTERVTCATCGHLREEHLLITDKSCTISDCACKEYRQALPFEIKVITSEIGSSRVIIQYGSTNLQLVPNAAVQIGLELLSAAYAARGEEALYKYAHEHDLDIAELLKLERE